MTGRRIRRWVFLALVVALASGAARVEAALTVSTKLEAFTTDNLTSYVTTAGAWTFAGGTSSTFSCASGAVCVCILDTSDDAVEGITGLTQTGQTWTQAGTAFAWASSNDSISVFTTPGTGSAAAGLTTSPTFADTHTGIQILCYEVAGGPNTSAPVAQTKTGEVTSLNQTITLDSARTSGSVLFHCVTVSADKAWTAEYAGTGSEMLNATPTRESRCQWDIGGADTTPLWTWASGSTQGGNVAVEIKPAGAAVPGCRGAMLLMGVGCLP